MALRNPLGKLFGPSPIRPIQEHMEKAHAAAEGLLPFLEASESGNWKRAREFQREIIKQEQEADKLKKFVRLHLPRSLLLPVSRSDLLDLVSMQDQIANFSRDVAELLLGRKMSFPQSMRELVATYASACVATTTQALQATNELDELLEVGFRGREVDIISDMINKLDKLEKQTDKLRLKLRSALQKCEPELPPVDVMFLYQVIDGIGDLANYSQKVGHRLQLVISR